MRSPLPSCLSCRRVERLDYLCVEATVFLTVSNLRQLTIPALDPVSAPDRQEFCDSFVNDLITFVLVRWFEPYPQSVERDCLHRPVCPPPLHINHFLWRYAKTATVRQSLPRRITPSWSRAQKHTYYGLILPVNISNLVNMTPCYLGSGVETGVDWLESVTLI